MALPDKGQMSKKANDWQNGLGVTIITALNKLRKKPK
jgi:hypothetical protein